MLFLLIELIETNPYNIRKNCEVKQKLGRINKFTFIDLLTSSNSDKLTIEKIAFLAFRTSVLYFVLLKDPYLIL
jgi:hypothetical protein